MGLVNYTDIDLRKSENVCTSYTIGSDGDSNSEALRIFVPPEYLACKFRVKVGLSDGQSQDSPILDYNHKGIVYILPKSVLRRGEIVISIKAVNTYNDFVKKLFERTFVVTRDAETDGEIPDVAYAELDERIRELEEKSGDWDAKYTFPDGGIPEEDLSQDVQDKVAGYDSHLMSNQNPHGVTYEQLGGTKPEYSASEILTSVPEKSVADVLGELERGKAASSHTHGNDDLTGLASWVKQVSKPSYSASEITNDVGLVSAEYAVLTITSLDPFEATIEQSFSDLIAAHNSGKKIILRVDAFGMNVVDSLVENLGITWYFVMPDITAVSNDPFLWKLKYRNDGKVEVNLYHLQDKSALDAVAGEIETMETAVHWLATQYSSLSTQIDNLWDEIDGVEELIGDGGISDGN